ncbi:hypothetical protein EV189_0861 [Motilibacter rhizosphaerae]|uniref:Uncharacterized protein n=1 Tax=Motilibacter rhizosphaerae TaxID=598652 RepID=A0A4Q7NWP6_9ACTN|nr:alpha/beta fold hydrolase [Motilibacter rhizosphaerae]RZS91614.1 hypothetical protein EV189_0861 [Motilibacter rhizosphaerae]
MTTSTKNALVAAGAAVSVALLGGATAASGATTSSTATAAPAASASPGTGWAGVTREPVSIAMGQGWTAGGELDYPAGATGRLPVLVLLHGSGHNDRDQTLPGGAGSTFVPIAQAAVAKGYAVLRFDKRGVTGVGPVLSTDAAQLAPARPYRRIVEDAAAVVRFAARSPHVDPSKIFLLGHSEGTQVASNLAAHPGTYGIPRPAGVVEMGVVGIEVEQLITFQVFGVKLARLHEQFDVDGDGTLTYREAVGGLVGQSRANRALLRPVLLRGSRVNPTTDRNHDGRISIDGEVGPVLRKAAGVDRYPDLTGVDAATRSYLADIARYPTAAQELPRYGGPVLLLNGQDDIQTPVRAAIVTDAALSAARVEDHTLITYVGTAHTMNRTPKLDPKYGPPDTSVVADISRWLEAHR